MLFPASSISRCRRMEGASKKEDFEAVELLICLESFGPWHQKKLARLWRLPKLRLTGKNIFLFCWKMTSNIIKNHSNQSSIITCHHQSSPSKTSAHWGKLQGSGARASLFMSAMDTYGQSLEKKIPRNVRKFNDKLIWIDCWLLNPYLHLTLKGD